MNAEQRAEAQKTGPLPCPSREREREMKWQERPDLDEMGSSQD